MSYRLSPWYFLARASRDEKGLPNGNPGREAEPESCETDLDELAETAGAARTTRRAAAETLRSGTLPTNCVAALPSPAPGIAGVTATLEAPPPPAFHSEAAGGSPSSPTKLMYNLFCLIFSGMGLGTLCDPKRQLSAGLPHFPQILLMHIQDLRLWP